ncbi:hypothetical protein C7450_104260 [Chelatococcus asaccharovorans]|uniref:Uncharacterized protein n=1 Tax=Chelatococcus asaccharovorans TaxID=28210 RepID=A0A2V3UBF8_9HYPH|nr:hypothetical protein C7450_104260 [Chelatococcus asaccharovorans]
MCKFIYLNEIRRFQASRICQGRSAALGSQYLIKYRTSTDLIKYQNDELREPARLGRLWKEALGGPPRETRPMGIQSMPRSDGNPPSFRGLASARSPESMNTRSEKKTRRTRHSMCLPWCSYFPGSGLSARPGMARWFRIKSHALRSWNPSPGIPGPRASRPRAGDPAGRFLERPRSATADQGIAEQASRLPSGFRRAASGRPARDACRRCAG